MRIVLNADDFGYSEDTARATIEAFERGCLSSATIMTGMPATDIAVAYALANPSFSFGLHLTLVGDGTERPRSEPGDVPDLVNDAGAFLGTTEVRLRLLLNALPAAQLEREITAQLADLRERGVAVSHVDSHRHLHKFAPVRRALRAVLPRFGIRRVRRVQDMYLRRPTASPTFWLGPRWGRGLTRDFVTTDHFYMPASAGDRDWVRFVELLDGFAGEASVEVGVHPGFDEEWRSAERASLAPFAERAREHGHRLVCWGEIAAT